MSLYTKIRIEVPDLPTSFRSGTYNYSTPSVKRSNIQMIQSINRQYNAQITRWGQVFDIPNGILIAFIATESGGKMLPPNQFRATGLMQVTPNAVWETARKWRAIVKSELPASARAEINRLVPEVFTAKTATPSAAVSGKILTLLQRDANFNILCGTMILRWLLERFSTQQTGGQLNKAMVAYNAGAYIRPLNISPSQPITEPIDTLTLATNRRVPFESRNYLYKMMGVDGFLALIYKDRAI